MSVGPLARADLARTSITEARSGGFKGSFVQPAGLVQSLSSQPNASAAGALLGAGSPGSSREASPKRQMSGPIPALSKLDWQALENPSLEPPACLRSCSETAAPKLDLAVLDSVPSFGYERGCRALWLDRHASLNVSRCAKGPSPHPSPRGPAPAQPAATDCLKYCPAWAISQSMIWSLAEQYVQNSQPPSPPTSPSPSAARSTGATPAADTHPPDAARSPATPAAAAAAAAADPKQRLRNPGTDGATTTTTASSPNAATSSSSTLAPASPASRQQLLSTPSRPALPLPCGLGVGLSTPPKLRFKRAALCVIARGRMQLRQGLKEAHAEDEEEEEENEQQQAVCSQHGIRTGGGGGGGSADGDDGNSPEKGQSTSTATAATTTTTTAAEGSCCKRQRAAATAATAAAAPQGRRGSREPDLMDMVSTVVADRVTPCPSGRRVVRRRVRALMAGVSVAYAAANLGGCAMALAHADFANDFANSAKAVLDFVVTAPSVTGMAADLLQIGVAVGLGIAQRRAQSM